jgi:dTDP-4-dehydrorhamnose reductase
MKAIITGMNGTVAPVLAAELQQQGYTTVAWDRNRVPTDDREAIKRFFDDTQPDWMFHVGMGSPDWAEMIAQECTERGIRLLFTSTVSVFGPTQQAPLTPDVAPAADDDYGRYKRECERRMLAAYPELIIARLAWQIGDEPGSNTMVNYIDRTIREKGELLASTNWFPACAFLADTAAGIARLTTDHAPGIYHLDGNDGFSFYAIAEGLKRVQQRDWPIVAAEEPVFDNRMHDPRFTIGPIGARLR